MSVNQGKSKIDWSADWSAPALERLASAKKKNEEEEEKNQNDATNRDAELSPSAIVGGDCNFACS